jgi:hypothetical protein
VIAIEFKLNEAMQILERTPKVIEVLFSGISKEWTNCDEGEGTWSPKEVVAHLIEGERHDWIPRLKICLEHGNERTFQTFDREGHKKFVKDSTLEQLIKEFIELRAVNINQLSTLIRSTKDLEQEGKHPDFGTVTVKELLATWTVHDLNHLHQITRTMANRYTLDVGPWIQYLGIYRK